jgi:hypothetical protein
MHAAELARIASVLMGAVNESQTLAAKARTGGRQFRDLVRHGREMHELLLEALLAYPSHSTAYLLDVAESQGLALDQLEALVIKPSGKAH